jgi:hypothetical protein
MVHVGGYDRKKMSEKMVDRQIESATTTIAATEGGHIRYRREFFGHF